jgi:hypothetical protein
MQRELSLAQKKMQKILKDYASDPANVGFDDNFTIWRGGGIKCRNYEVCEMLMLRESASAHNNYVCALCMLFFGGPLTFSAPQKPQLCRRCACVSRAVKYQDCVHFLCVQCFRLAWMGPEAEWEDEPPFPYDNSVRILYDAFYLKNNPNFDAQYIGGNFSAVGPGTKYNNSSCGGRLPTPNRHTNTDDITPFVLTFPLVDKWRRDVADWVKRGLQHYKARQDQRDCPLCIHKSE